MLNRIKKLFLLYNIDGYLIPKNDEFFGEYSFPDRLRSVTKFSGSAGFAIILEKQNYLFVDGRYSIQAEQESGKKFIICEISKNDPASVFQKSKKHYKLGFDPKLFTENFLNKNINNNCEFIPLHINLVDKIHKIKSTNKDKPFYNLNDKTAGESVVSKINRVRDKLTSKKIDNLFISSPDNCAWLLNIRGFDQPYSPIPNCRIILDKFKRIYFFSEIYKSKKIKKGIKYKNIKFFGINEFFKIISKLDGKSFCIDEKSCSIYHKSLISSKFKIIGKKDPCEYLKSIKNKTELKNMVRSHILDGVALTKFLFWIKKNNNNKLTEIQASRKLEKFRRLNSDYLFPSFKTISGSGPNGAIIHYNVNKKTNRKINKKDIYLCDSGGHYKYGTTDVTRTICFSEPNKKIKDIFTMVLKGHIAVVNTNLNKHKYGKIIDLRARRSLRSANMDYPHGTGHGVGYFLNVHEGPQAISKFNTIKFEPSMIVSNEPGYYKKNKFGIRIENLIYVVKSNKKTLFKNLTLVPIDKNLINLRMLNKKEKEYLNNYHQEVYNKLHNYLNLNERVWLKSLI